MQHLEQMTRCFDPFYGDNCPDCHAHNGVAWPHSPLLCHLPEEVHQWRFVAFILIRRDHRLIRASVRGNPTLPQRPWALEPGRGWGAERTIWWNLSASVYLKQEWKENDGKSFRFYFWKQSPVVRHYSRFRVPAWVLQPPGMIPGYLCNQMSTITRQVIGQRIQVLPEVFPAYVGCMSTVIENPRLR